MRLRACMLRCNCLCAYIPYSAQCTIADAIEYGTESFEGKEILDNLIVEGLKKLIKNW